jgi:threonine synthase
MPGTDPEAGPGGWSSRCGSCGERYPVLAPVWRCRCGGLLGLVGPVAASPVDPTGPSSLWRYAPALPPLPAWKAVTLGEGMTPLVPAGPDTWLKLDFVQPTLSFKDRGAAVLIAAAAGAGIRRVVADSSGNAGTSIAAYAARAGIAAEIFVPAITSQKKVAAMAAHGATVRRVQGDRTDTALAARRRVDDGGGFWASHVYQPLFVHGVKTLAYELWEQLGAPPSQVVVPAGNGTLVLGLAIGFAELAEAGLVAEAPAVVAVQASRCAPLAGATPVGVTVAEGIAVPEPPRKAEVLAAVASSGGTVLTVPDEEILAAQADLAARGIWVEPTAAAAWAAHTATALAASSSPAGRAEPRAGNGSTVVVLCGAGLKGA